MLIHVNWNHDVIFVNYRKTQRAKKLKLRDTQREATLEV